MKISALKGARDAGATVMTGGFYLLYKGLFQRVTTERKVRQIALKKIEKKQKKAGFRTCSSSRVAFAAGVPSC
jgi:hypothetical protein